MTGVEIGFGESITASLDRIDNKLPYQIGNLQWVHKNVNIMKRNLTHEQFVGVCRLVVKKFGTDDESKSPAAESSDPADAAASVLGNAFLH